MQSDAVDGGGPPLGLQKSEYPDTQAMTISDEQPPRLPFPVIGIGASAGGLEAITNFLHGITADSGMAYVFIQHLPPTGESLLVEILSRSCPVPVVEVADQLSIEPNHLYIIRPGHTLTLLDGVFRLGERLARPMHNRPVDDFFKSLAQEQRQRAIGVLLSGMGSNGTAGAQAIKAVGGICIAQDPESAQFPSMPQHLIDAGYADYVLAPQDMGGVLRAYAGHPYTAGEGNSPAQLAKTDQQHLREILAVLRTRTRQDFNGYKKPTVIRRIQRRMGLNRVTKMGEYAKLLRQSMSEVAALADDLLIHVTGFFRDPEAWEALRELIIIPLINSREPDSSIRCWVTACASGEEAYSLAMLLVEEAERVDKPLDIKVFATDMAERTLANARNGVFPGGIEAEIEPKRLERFFQREDAMYRVRQDLRERMVFAPQNLLQDPPFSRLDIITCRNLLIYLEPEMQQRILSLLHFGLRDGGTLFLGNSETAGGQEQLFETIDKKARLYRRLGPTRHGSLEFPLPHAIASSPGTGGNVSENRAVNTRPSITQMSTRALLEHHTPPAVTIDRERRIVFYHGNTEPFISAPRGEPTRDLMELVRENVRSATRTAVHRAASGEKVATVADGWAETEPGKRVRIAVTASQLDSKNAQDYIVVSFHERGDEPQVDTSSPVQVASAEFAEELRRMREEVQSTIEELQTSNEELKASHEEVVSVNEELQSSNEELETSREEMQSLNEELSTVNSQLQSKIEEHQAARNDLSSLLTSTNIAVLFLDTRLRIRRFTPQVRELFEMLESDLGRPVTDLATKFTDPNLKKDAESVLRTLVPLDQEVPAQNDRWFLRRVTPYRTADNRIDGVVISFIEITSRLRAETALRISEQQTREQFERTSVVLESISDAFFAVDLEFRFTYVNHKAELLLGRRREDLSGRVVWTEFPHAAGTALHQLHLKAMQTRQPVQDEVLSPFTNRWIDVNLYPEASGGLSCYFRDITEKRQAAESLRASEERFRLFVQGASDFAMLMLDSSAVIFAWNDGATRLTGYSQAEAIGTDAAIIFTPEDRDSGAPERELAEARRTGRAQDERWHMRKDGTRFWGSGAMTALRRPDGSIHGYVKIFRDETARKNAEDALVASKLAAEQASQAKDEFIAVLSHELRTPLSAILLWSRMLSVEGRPESVQWREGLAAITSSAEAQKELIEDLLDISRITSGNLRLQLRHINPAAVMEAAVEAIVPVAQAKGVELSYDLRSDCGVVLADADRLRQVVWNLLTNAVKFTPAQGKVTVTLERVDDQAEIRVSDTGRGIEPDFISQIFERFSQAERVSTRTQGGLGLGLSIVKQLVELHSGTIDAQSPGVGQGATFIVRLPIAQALTPAFSFLRSKALPRQLDLSQLHNRRVLLVEDDELTRQALANVLKNAGLNVCEADSADAGLQAFAQHSPELVISDIGMPQKDGYALLEQIRKAEARLNRPAVPVIALTAFVQSTDRAKAIKAGFYEHIAKPVDAEFLVNFLCQALLDRGNSKIG